MVELDLPYGRAALRVRLDGDVFVAEAHGPEGLAPALAPMLAAALDRPVDSRRLEDLAPARATVVVSDATRAEPRAEMLAAVRARLRGTRVTVAVATGTHGPCRLEALGIPTSLLAGADVVMHDGHRDDDLVLIGETRRGTPVRVHRCVVDTDLVVATGAIRPHYFAGFGAGIKAVFPGLGGAHEVRINHRLKELPGARAGVVDGNPCREDLEEAASLLPPIFLCNTVHGPDDTARAAVAGHVLSAFRAGADLARPWFRTSAPRTRCAIISDGLPVTGSLYQASKLVAAIAPLLDDDATIILVAECPDGTGPVDIVNRAIYDIGLRPRLPPRHRILLVSGLPASAVSATYAIPAPSVAAALSGVDFPVVVAPRASHLILE
jgi:nickel-dependent lactate racemase